MNRLLIIATAIAMLGAATPAFAQSVAENEKAQAQAETLRAWQACQATNGVNAPECAQLRLAFLRASDEWHDLYMQRLHADVAREKRR